MDFSESEDHRLVREAVRDLCGRFDDGYWAECDRTHAFPWAFYDAMAAGGWVGIAIPEEYGGGGQGIDAASIVLEEVAASGAVMNGASAVHMSIFGMHPVIVHGSEELKQRTLPRIVDGDLHVCFGVTEPGAGLDTSRITTFAERDGDAYVVNGRKVWISKAQESEKVLLLTRTAKREEELAGLLAALVRAEVGVTQFREVQTDLEEAFMSLAQSNDEGYDERARGADRDVVSAKVVE